MSGHNTGAVLEGQLTRRGTSNSNARGSAEDRRRRREWLVAAWRADVDVLRVTYAQPGSSSLEYAVPAGEVVGVVDALLDVERAQHEVLGHEVLPACRCYRCGRPLSVHTVTADRIVPGCQGGTYRRSNLRPACADCNSVTGGRTRS